MAEEIRKRGRPRSFHDKSATNTVQSLEKAIRVLKATASSTALPLSTIAEQSEVSAPTAYRVLITLQQHGMVSFDERQQLWQIGVESYRIGTAFLKNSSIAEQARPVMNALNQQTGETINLGIVENNDVIFLTQVETHEPIRAFFRPGSKGAIHTSGIGKAVLAFIPQDRRNRIIEGLELSQFTEKSITNADNLHHACKKIREAGFAIDDEERTVGMRCVAAPIFNLHQEAVAAISISGPSVRMEKSNLEKFADLVKEAAAKITSNVGGAKPRQRV